MDEFILNAVAERFGTGFALLALVAVSVLIWRWRKVGKSFAGLRRDRIIVGLGLTVFGFLCFSAGQHWVSPEAPDPFEAGRLGIVILRPAGKAGESVQKALGHTALEGVHGHPALRHRVDIRYLKEVLPGVAPQDEAQRVGADLGADLVLDIALLPEDEVALSLHVIADGRLFVPTIPLAVVPHPNADDLSEAQIPDKVAAVSQALVAAGLYQTEKYAMAVAGLQDVLRSGVIRSMGLDEFPVQVLLAAALYGDGHYARAVGFLQQLRRTHPDSLHLLNRLSVALIDAGRPGQAIEFLQQGLRPYELTAERDAAWADMTHNLADAYLTLGQSQEAIPLLHEVLSAHGPDFPDDSPLRISSTRSLALAHFQEGDPNRALELLEKALEALRQTGQEEGTVVAMTHDQIGLVLMQLGRHKESERHLRKALSLKRKLFEGRPHPSIARTLFKLGEISEHSGRIAQALDYYQTDLEISRATIGDHHHETAVTAESLARLALNTGDANSAREYMALALTGFASSFGQEHPRTRAAEALLREIPRD